MSFTTLRSFSSKIVILGGFGNKGAYIRPPRIINTTKFGSLSSLLLRQYSTKKYTKEHEWINVDNGIGIIGITDYAQTALGDVVFVEIPEVGQIVEKSDNIGAVESVKAASDIYSPVGGKIIESNHKLSDEPSLINKSPEGDGWLCKIELNNHESELDKLLSEEEYNEYCSSESH